MTVHILKLCVGADSVEELKAWQDWQLSRGYRAPVCGTRAWPKRREDVLAGGSLYWVIKGLIVVRQAIVDIAEVEDEHGLRCGLYLDRRLVRVQPHPKRAFQGWRYLEAKDAPRDLQASEEGLPEELRRQLAQLGAL